MEQPFRVEITNERRTKRHRVLEFRVHAEGSEDPFLAIASLYGPELHLNLPANPDADAFVKWLSQKVGEPSGPPVVKCSAQWSENMIGPMQTITWQLESKGLEAFDLVFQ